MRQGQQYQDTLPQYANTLLIGGARLCHSWHNDPKGTSTWNLTIHGRKGWLLFPLNFTPPGVIMSGDGSKDYITPIFPAKFAHGYYMEACLTPGLLECKMKAVKVMQVSRGWWHMVLNVYPIIFTVSYHFPLPTGLYNTLRLI